MLEMALFIFEMLLATMHALLTRLASHTAPSFMFAHWQSFQFDVYNKAANSKQYFEDKVLIRMGIEKLRGQDLKDRQSTYMMPYGLEQRKGECDLVHLHKTGFVV